MATILFAWELGANLGHLIPLSHIVRRLHGGHRCVFAVRDLAYALSVLGPDAEIVQAPLWPRHRYLGAASGVVAGYTDILAAIGFADAPKLAAVAAAWRSLIDLVSPDLVVADHSPGLLVALYRRDIPVVAVGTGFTMPPVDYDRLPPLRGDLPSALPDARLFEAIRDACSLIDAPRPQTLVEVFRTPYRIVFGLPELDPYQSYRRELMVAPPGGLPRAMAWPPGRRLFVYAGSEMGNFDALLQGLATVTVPLEVYLRGDTAPAREFLRLRGATVHEQPPQLADVLSLASHVISQGGAGTTAAAFSAGRPQLIVALHDEALLNYELLKRHGVAQKLEPSSDPAEVTAAIDAFLGDPLLPDNALDAANRIARRPLPDGAAVAADVIRSALARSAS